MTRTGTIHGTWREVDPAWYVAAYPVAQRLLSETGTDSPASVYHAVGHVFLHSPNPYFDERWYRARYPEVREAIRKGRFESGFAHYRVVGSRDFSPHWLFEPGYYRASFQQSRGHSLPTDAEADPYRHFLETGQHEGLSGHFLFNPAIYTATAAYDLVRRIDREGPFTTCLQQMHAGGDPTTSVMFDPAWYRARYSASLSGKAGKIWLCALHHYLTNNEPTAFDPGPGFCEASYRAWHFDVAESVRRGECRNGFEHYMRAGRRQRRYFTNARAPASLPATARFPLRTNVVEDLVLNPDGGPEMPQTAGEQSLARETAPPEDTDRPFHPGTFIYGGTLWPDLQRCLSASLGRLWFLRERPELPVLWHAANPLTAQGTWPSWLGQLWGLLGLDRHTSIFVTEPAIFQRVIVPEPGLMDSCAIHPRQVEALGVYPATTQPTGSRIWLSHRRPARENESLEQLETILAARGWAIERPEDLSLPRYLDLFTEAAILAGADDTVFLPVLMAAKPTAALIPVLRPGAPVPLLEAVAQAKQICQMFVIPKLRPLAGAPESVEFADPAGLADTICEAADQARQERRLARLESGSA